MAPDLLHQLGGERLHEQGAPGLRAGSRIQVQREISRRHTIGSKVAEGSVSLRHLRESAFKAQTMEVCNMKTFATAAAACIALAGCASVPPGINQYNHYGVAMSSQQTRATHMTLSFDGKQVCSGEIAKGAPHKCDAVAATPRNVTVRWGTPGQPGSSGDRVAPISWFYQLAPRWFRAGDVMNFTVTQFDQLSVVFVCHRPGDACASYPPFTAYGKSVGNDLGYAVSDAQ